ncbi:MAG: nuclear transport factor 2 family protein [Ferruginibacter sp.]
MKKIFLSILFFAFIGGLTAQSKSEIAVLAKVQQLNNAVFVTKDSVVMEKLVSEKLTYGHSSGVVESKASMIRHASSNKNTYVDIKVTEGSITIEKKTAIVRHIFSATQTVDGKVSPLKLIILQVWQKEKGKWKLLARQAVKFDVGN